MNNSPTLSERASAALGTAIYGAPVSFLFWMVINLLLKSSGGLSMSWVVAGIILFIVLGFTFPRSFGQTFKLK